MSFLQLQRGFSLIPSVKMPKCHTQRLSQRSGVCTWLHQHLKSQSKKKVTGRRFTATPWPRTEVWRMPERPASSAGPVAWRFQKKNGKKAKLGFSNLKFRRSFQSEKIPSPNTLPRKKKKASSHIFFWARGLRKGLQCDQQTTDILRLLWVGSGEWFRGHMSMMVPSD